MANRTSSRSHAVLQIVCEKTVVSGDQVLTQIGKFNLIDLAGSERASKTQNRGMRLQEGAHINRSLLALGNCINMLHSNSKKGMANHVPFRDSKLTRILKDSLTGNCKTVMIANVSPHSDHFEESHNTLKYANRTKELKTYALKNKSIENDEFS